MSPPVSPAPLLTLSHIRADLALLARDRTLLDPFLSTSVQLQDTTVEPSESTSLTMKGKKIDPTVPPTDPTESLKYAQGFVQATRKGVMEISEGSAVGEMGGWLERVREELEGIGAGLEGH
jgi:hypothetical protein